MINTKNHHLTYHSIYSIKNLTSTHNSPKVFDAAIIYVDAVEWGELSNTLVMSQYADGSVMASKPYVASGKYIQRMSNYCKTCGYSPEFLVGRGRTVGAVRGKVGSFKLKKALSFLIP